MTTLLRREVTSLALWAGTYAIAVAYIITSGVFFIDLVSANKTSDLASYYANVLNTLIVLCPILAARSLAEERANGALLISLAWPVSRWSLILSKFAANTLYTWLLISISWIYYTQLNSFANPEFARVFGGWLGLALLVMMFNAVALAISAFANSAASAAFVGFGVLLFLRIIDFLPQNIRGKVDQFGPLNHLDAMLDGVIPFEDVAYFLVLSAGALALAVAAISRRRAGADRQVLLRRAASVGGAAALFLATPGIAGTASGEIDMTPNERETVSRATSDVLAKIDDVPIVLTAFSAETSAEAAETRGTVRKYRAGGANITERIVDPDVSPALAQASGVANYNTYQLKVGDRTTEINDLVESTLTTAIARLAGGDLPLACFTQGHGERQLTSVLPEGLTSFAARLRVIGYEPAQVFLSADGAPELKEKCDVVIVMGPRTKMPAAEVATLREYAQAKGRLLLAADSVRGDLGQLNTIVEPFGLQFLAGPIRDPQSLADDPAAVVSSRYASSSEIVDVLSNDDTPVVFSNTVAIDRTSTGADGPQLASLVQTSPQAYRLTPAGERLADSQAVYTIAGFLRAGELTGSGEEAVLASTRVGLLGSADVATNRYQQSFGNQEFVIRLLQFLAEEDEIVSAFREVGSNARFDVTGEQRNTLVRQAVVLPALAAFVFVPFVLWRLRRG